MSEIIRCSSCRTEYELVYSMRNDEEVVAQSLCKCNKQDDKEKLNKALKQLAIKFGLKQRKVSNAKNQSSTRKVSR